MSADPGERVVVVGAGVMGAGIVQVFAQAGFEVRVHARRQQSLDVAIARIQANQQLLVESGMVSQSDADEALARVKPTTDFDRAVDGATFVNEAVPEQLDAKRAVFRRLEAMLPADVPIATNTSALEIGEITEGMMHRERTLGLHWLNPTHLMPMVEVIRGPHTSDAALERMMQLVRRTGKVPVVLQREVPGFLLNRLQYALMREAFGLVEEGIASPKDIDTVIKLGLGFRWAVLGGFEHFDLSGLDTVVAVARSLFPSLDASTEPHAMLERLAASNKLGIKAGSGFYEYPGNELQAAVVRRDSNLITMLKTLGYGGGDCIERE